MHHTHSMRGSLASAVPEMCIGVRKVKNRSREPARPLMTYLCIFLVGPPTVNMRIKFEVSAIREICLGSKVDEIFPFSTQLCGHQDPPLTQCSFGFDSVHPKQDLDALSVFAQ